jgi:hypothetical protein
MGRHNPICSLCLPITLLAICFSSVQAQQNSPENPGATTPRTSAEKYASHAEKNGLAIGAQIIPKKQVQKEFAANVNSCCVVVQVAVYPNNGGAITLSHFDFGLMEQGQASAVKPWSATELAQKVEKKSEPSGGTDVTRSAGVGYETGSRVDPVTGQTVRGHGITTNASVAVGVEDGLPDDVERQRLEMMERQLSEKALPEAKISVPVAGYLFFPIAKQTKGAKYQLQYTVKGQTLVIDLP